MHLTVEKTGSQPSLLFLTYRASEMCSFVLNSNKRDPDPSVQISLTFSRFEKGIIKNYSVLAALSCVSSVGVTASPFTDVISLPAGAFQQRSCCLCTQQGALWGLWVLRPFNGNCRRTFFAQGDLRNMRHKILNGGYAYTYLKAVGMRKKSLI